MKEINVYFIVRDVLKNLWAIILFTIAAALIAFSATTFLYSPRYQSNAFMIVKARTSASDNTANLTVTSKAADVFNEMLQSDIMKETISNTTGITFEDVKLSCKRIENTNMLNFAVTAATPKRAFDTIKAVLDNYLLVTQFAFGDLLLDVIDPPTTPDEPVDNEYLTRNVVIITAVAFIGSIALIAFLSYLRDTIKDPSTVEKKLDTKLLATISHEKTYKNLKEKMKGQSGQLLITDSTTGFAFSETIKALCAKLEYNSKKNNEKVILFTSNAPHEGKTSVTSNVAICLAQRGRKVILLDCDMRNPSQKEIFTEYNGGNYMHDILTGQVKLDKAIFNSAIPNLDVIMNKEATESTEILESERMDSLLKYLKERYDFVIIDTPPESMVSDVEVLANKVDSSILIVRQDTSRTEDIISTLEVLEKSSSNCLGVVLNDVRSFENSLGSYGGGYYIGGKYNYAYSAYSSAYSKAYKDAEEKPVKKNKKIVLTDEEED